MNLQIHCDNCDKTIWREGEFDRMAAPPGVHITHGHAHAFRDEGFAENRFNFCDWGCLAGWAIDKGHGDL